ncbi:MAG: 30S ribosomal protein S18 [Firmicutes bacterium]|nr:30S ribosomal protein S18 [Bacillota bacterium]
MTRNQRRPQKRKVCMFCTERMDYIDYKDVSRLKKFTTERGKIIPMRVSGVCYKHQRTVTAAIKKARIVALLPFTSD